MAHWFTDAHVGAPLTMTCEKKAVGSMAHCSHAVAKLGPKLQQLRLHGNLHRILPTTQPSLATNPVASPPPHRQSAMLNDRMS